MSWGVALRNAVGLGLGGIPSLRNAPSLRAALDFNFLSGLLDPRITFSRTSNATLIGSNGQIQYAPHNLLTYSEQFDNAAWSKFQGTVTANATISPDGTTTADVFIPDTNAGDHGIVGLLTSQDLSITRTFSIYLKASGLTTFAIYVRNNAQTIGIQGNVDLSAGTITASNYGAPISVLTPTITAVGNGWFRCTIGGALSATTETLRVGILRNFTGDGTSGLYVWGAQLNVGALQPYYQTVASAYYGPRFDYDPVTLAPNGLLIEEQRTNICLYSSDLNQAIWAKGSTVSLTYDTTTAPDGTITADTITVVSGADTGVHQSIACSSSTTYTWSLYVKLGTMAASDYKIAIYDNTNAAFIASDIVPTQTPSSTAWTRVTYTFTTPATCVSVRPYCFRNSLSAATSVNVWGMQLEQGAFATSVIPTTTAAATRAADVASMTGANFSSWYNQTEGTTLVETATLPNVTAAVVSHAISDGTFNQSIYGNFSGGNAYRGANVLDGGVGQTLSIATFTGITATNNTKDAFAYKLNDFAESCNGVATRTDSVGTVPVVNRLYIGTNWSAIGNFLNGHIRSFKYYPTRLSNGQLQSLTVLPLWTPAALGASLALWLDANDASTITLNGSNVSQWGDKSGNGRNAVQATAATQPVYSATSFNGKPTLTWDGIDDAMQISMSLPATDINLFAVLAPDVVTQGDYIFDIPTVRRVFSTSGQIFSGSWLPSAAPITAGGQRLYGFTTGPANQITYSDGTAISTIAALPAAVVDGSVGLGNRNISGGSFGLDGNMSELVFVSGTLSTDNRQKLEGYLAWKWGLQANLPVGHPYKDAPPTV